MDKRTAKRIALALNTTGETTTMIANYKWSIRYNNGIVYATCKSVGVSVNSASNIAEDTTKFTGNVWQKAVEFCVELKLFLLQFTGAE